MNFDATIIELGSNHKHVVYIESLFCMPSDLFVLPKMLESLGLFFSQELIFLFLQKVFVHLFSRFLLVFKTTLTCILSLSLSSPHTYTHSPYKLSLLFLFSVFGVGNAFSQPLPSPWVWACIAVVFAATLDNATDRRHFLACGGKAEVSSAPR